MYREVGNICSGGLTIYFRHLPRRVFLTFASLFFLINPYILIYIYIYMFLVFSIFCYIFSPNRACDEGFWRISRDRWLWSRGARSGVDEKSGCGEGLAHFWRKKVAVAREWWLPMPSSRATATFFWKNAPRSSHSHFFFIFDPPGPKMAPRSAQDRPKLVLRPF